jgi:hypothetical protein
MFKHVADDPALRWSGPHKGVVHLGTGSITKTVGRLEMVGLRSKSDVRGNSSRIGTAVQASSPYGSKHRSPWFCVVVRDYDPDVFDLRPRTKCNLLLRQDLRARIASMRSGPSRSSAPAGAGDD